MTSYIVRGDKIRLSNDKPYVWYLVISVEQQPIGQKITFSRNGKADFCYDDDVFGVDK